MGYTAVFDAQDNLYVSDLNRGRVLRYDQPFASCPERVADLTATAETAATWSLDWSPAEGAAQYELCVSNHPNPDGAWFCAAPTTNTSIAGATVPVPPAGSKFVYFHAVRAIGANGQKGVFSNRVALISFNEQVSGVPFTSYLIAYKDAVGVKMVDGFNKNLNDSRLLAFSNVIEPTEDISALTPPNTAWPGAPVPWDADDWGTGYGPLIEASVSTADEQTSDGAFLSTYCMWITPLCE